MPEAETIQQEEEKQNDNTTLETTEQQGDQYDPTSKTIKPKLESRLGRDSPFDFGQRYLTDESKVFEFNAWDNVSWDSEQVSQFQTQIELQQQNAVSDFDKKQFNANPSKYWNIFYKNNKRNFFKDRKWLQIEFPAIFELTKPDSPANSTILEIGCGVGNTMFPIMEANQNPGLTVHGCDYSKVAIDLIKEKPEYVNQADHYTGKCHASVWDLANTEGELPEELEPHSVDVAIMVFVFSALNPDQWKQAIVNLAKVMKPNGKVLFRDYGRYDLAQVRFKKNRYLQENFYVRGDGTRVYFFTEEELIGIFKGDDEKKEVFKNVKIASDKRLLVNRKKQLKMYRCWIQAVFEFNGETI
ncbi:unnamed protein product [Ambrosiozyma monospora]|uniref:Unnamed protein product n=1 Tax=Ambrosiozyma monospora TaxID=43982 RepID=A0ACB5SXC1_AMBMO|nr:unnamed protein product [Ambrosiozyma monospora]